MEHLTVLSEPTFSSENQSYSKTSPKIQCEVRFVGTFMGPIHVLRKTFMLQPGFYCPMIHLTKTFNKLKFSLSEWADDSSYSLL